MGAAPVFETIVRVPGGEVAHRAYGAAAASGAVVVVEVENRSPVPLTVALVVRIAARGRVEFDGIRVARRRSAGARAVAPARARGRRGESTVAPTVTAGDAARSDRSNEPRSGRDHVALPGSAPHVPARRARRPAGVEPGPRRSTCATCPTPTPSRAVGTASSSAGCRSRCRRRSVTSSMPPAPISCSRRGASRRVVAALEDWGFDDEAATVGPVSVGARAPARPAAIARPTPWAAVRAADRRATRPVSCRRCARRSCASAGCDRAAPGFPAEWLGQSVTVDAVPLRAGTLSFAVRWHGARPALLWEAPPGVELRAPALDPGVVVERGGGGDAAGRAAAPLLPMGTQERSAGEPVDAPGQFS